MKKYILLTAMVLMLAAPGSAWCQNNPSGNSGNAPGAGAQGQDFQARKAEIIQHISAHLAEMQQRLNCVQAATNHEALRACMPQKGEGRGER